MVSAIHISPGRGVPMKAVEHATVTAGHGIEGDRYRNTRHRHVSVQSAEDLAEASELLGSVIEPSMTRRNITVRGVNVPTKPGTQFSIGDVRLEVVRIAAPCRLLDDDIGDGARVALRRRAGSIMRVLSDGEIALGDLVESGELLTR